MIALTLFVESQKSEMGVLSAVMIADAVAILLSLITLAALPETFGKDLDDSEA